MTCACPAPAVIAPAMNVEMWHHPAVRSNVEILRSRGHRFVDPEAGSLACGTWGTGGSLAWKSSSPKS